MSSAKKTIIILIAILVLAVAGFFAFLTLQSRPVDSSDSEQIIVEVPQGSSTAQIATLLEDQGLIRSSFVFRLQSKIKGNDGNYQAGWYAFRRDMSQNEIMRDIASGKSAGLTFTIAQGQSLEKIGTSLEKQKICTKEEFIDEVQNGDFDYKFMKQLPKGPTRLEGFLWPDTYTISVKGGAHEAIDVMLAEFDRNITSDYYKAAKRQGMSLYELITEASIIEREASFAEDKPIVASVIRNRLEKDMFLQMDSILAYITGEERVIASWADVNVESDFNPYQNKGLPPGPICSPGKASIDAAADPADTEYLFFVTSPKLDGSLVFAENEAKFFKDKEAFEKAYAEYMKEQGEGEDGDE